MALVLLKRIFIMFAFMAIGCILYKRKLVSDQGTKTMGNVLLYIVVPAVIIKSFNIPSSPDITSKMLISFAAGGACMALSMIIAWLVFRKNPMENFSAAFFNSGFLGVPLVAYVLGEDSVIYVVALVFLIGFLQWTYGVYIITKDKKNIAPKKIIFNPSLIGLVLGLIVYFMPFDLPALITTGINDMAAMNAPLAMLILGAYFAQTDVKKFFTDKQAYLVCLIRLVITPLATLALLSVLPRSLNSIRLAVLINVITPVGSNAPIFGQLFDKDYVSSTRYVSLSTILCIISMPLVILLANLLWVK
ncbi:MAG: AEC family transporter [Lachnospiraceae bacterium]|nr:AEC family transporter [Lachnospiraceae bacterium]